MLHGLSSSRGEGGCLAFKKKGREENKKEKEIVNREEKK